MNPSATPSVNRPAYPPVSPGPHAVLAEGLEKRYGEKRALDGFDLTVARGTVHGLLGPNGAGKTTVVRILSTLVRLDGGRAEVAGIDVAGRPARSAAGSASPASTRRWTRSPPPVRTW